MGRYLGAGCVGSKQVHLKAGRIAHLVIIQILVPSRNLDFQESYCVTHTA